MDTKSFTHRGGSMKLLPIGLMCLLLAGCAHRQSVEAHQQKVEERCYPILNEILKIQYLRDELSNRMNRDTASFEAGDISLEAYREIRETWIDLENDLAGDVANLYSKARRGKCFEEVR